MKEEGSEGYVQNQPEWQKGMPRRRSPVTQGYGERAGESGTIGRSPEGDEAEDDEDDDEEDEEADLGAEAGPLEDCGDLLLRGGKAVLSALHFLIQIVQHESLLAQFLVNLETDLAYPCHRMPQLVQLLILPSAPSHIHPLHPLECVRLTAR